MRDNEWGSLFVCVCIRGKERGVGGGWLLGEEPAIDFTVVIGFLPLPAHCKSMNQLMCVRDIWHHNTQTQWNDQPCTLPSLMNTKDAPMLWASITMHSTRIIKHTYTVHTMPQTNTHTQTPNTLLEGMFFTGLMWHAINTSECYLHLILHVLSPHLALQSHCSRKRGQYLCISHYIITKQQHQHHL